MKFSSNISMVFFLFIDLSRCKCCLVSWNPLFFFASIRTLEVFEKYSIDFMYITTFMVGWFNIRKYLDGPMWNGISFSGLTALQLRKVFLWCKSIRCWCGYALFYIETCFMKIGLITMLKIEMCNFRTKECRLFQGF